VPAPLPARNSAASGARRERRSKWIGLAWRALLVRGLVRRAVPLPEGALRQAVVPADRSGSRRTARSAPSSRRSCHPRCGPGGRPGAPDLSCPGTDRYDLDGRWSAPTRPAGDTPCALEGVEGGAGSKSLFAGMKATPGMLKAVDEQGRGEHGNVIDQVLEKRAHLAGQANFCAAFADISVRDSHRAGDAASGR
jgi:hypothetical protein